MRRDEIGERIVQLEQEFRTFRADQREGVEAILAGMREFQNSVIEERVESLRIQMAKSYERMFFTLLLRNVERSLDGQCPEECIRNRREECHTFLVSRLRALADLPSSPEVKGHPGFFLSDEDLVRQAPFLAKPPCADCLTIYRREKEQLVATLDGLRSMEDRTQEAGAPLFISGLPDTLVVSEIVGPLSHESRFAMLKALSTGSMTFKELGQLTGSKGGHLLYHLGKLMDAGLVIKSDAGKRYAITDRGMGVMELVKRLYART